MMSTGPVKILFFVTEDWYFWSHRLPIARAALQRGMQVTVVCRVANHAEKIKTEGFNLIPIDINRSGKNPFCELYSFFSLLRIYLREKPDIVHHVALKPALYGSWAARFAGVPHVVNALAGLGHLFISKGKRDSFLRIFVKSALCSAFGPRKVKIIFQNPDDRSSFIDAGLVSPQQTYIIKGSGVDTTIFKPSCSPHGTPIVILLARMLWTKGVGEFVEAARILKGKGKSVRMVLVGEPDPMNPASIPQKTLTKWDAEGIVEYWGRKNNVAEILQKSSISVLPSYREGLPKSLIESAAAGLPLIAFDAPGCREIIRHGINGLLVPFKDITALADAIEQLLDQPVLRKEMGLKGREIVKKEFSQEIVIEKTLDLYRELLGERFMQKQGSTVR